jgi:tagatose 1,6-diphosphate aldolase
VNNLSTGKIRSLQQIANANGIFTICAMDHRGSMKKMVNPENPDSVTYQQMVARKLELCAALAPFASAVLLDPLYGAAQCISRNVLPRQTGLLVSIEASGYSGGDEKRLATLLENWGAAKIKRMGAQAVKLLTYYRPDVAELVAQQQQIIRQVGQDCITQDIPLLVEPVTFPLAAEAASPEKLAARKEELVIETAKQLTTLPLDVLKTEFPADMKFQQDRNRLTELCHQLNEATTAPWVLLSRGVDYDIFCEQVEIACKAGASGFLGGRAIWQESQRIADAAERGKFLSSVVAARQQKLNEIASTYGVPWYKKLNLDPAELNTVKENWYRQY